jgi:hypothetical protein
MTLASADFRAPARRVPHVRALEPEAIHVMREVVAEPGRPVLILLDPATNETVGAGMVGA